MSEHKELEKRDIVIRYLKSVDYSLKPSKEIYDRVKQGIISLSGIEANVNMSYAELCNMAGLSVKEGKELIKSLYNKEVIKVIKSYDGILLNQQVEACFVTKEYCGENIPDIAFLTEEQAFKYVADIVKLGTNMSIYAFLDKENLIDFIELLSIAKDDKATIISNYRSYGFKHVLKNLLQLTEIVNESKASTKPVDYVREFLEIAIKNSKKGYDLGHLLTNVIRYNNNIHNKYHCSTCRFDDGDMRYMYPF